MITELSKSLLTDSYGAGDNIGLFSVNCPEWTIVDVAILNIRAVVVPIFATATKEQVKYIVDETQMKLMFVGGKEQLEKAVWLLEHSDTLEKVVVFDDKIELHDSRCLSLKDYLNHEKLPAI